MGTNSQMSWTAFADEVMLTCQHLGSEVHGVFTVGQVAERMGRKVTHNLRRRINQLCDAGVLQKSTWYTPAGGMSYCYYLRDDLRLQELPF